MFQRERLSCWLLSLRCERVVNIYEVSAGCETNSEIHDLALLSDDAFASAIADEGPARTWHVARVEKVEADHRSVTELQHYCATEDESRCEE